MSKTTLYLANKNYSSWSLRAWLALKQTGAEFEEVVIPLREAATRENILRHSPSAKLPALKLGEGENSLTIWDSLAICEFLAEKFPEAGLWPGPEKTRALARAVSAEMHSGFLPLRRAMPMNMRSLFTGFAISDEVQADINRITAIWRECRKRAEGELAGDFLFGDFTIADAMFAPVVSRFITYGVDLGGVAKAYSKSVMAHPAMTEWMDAAEDEPWIIPDYEYEEKEE